MDKTDNHKQAPLSSCSLCGSSSCSSYSFLSCCSSFIHSFIHYHLPLFLSCSCSINLRLIDLMTVFCRHGFGILQSDLCWFHSSTGWSVLLNSAILSWSAGAGFFAHYKDMETRETLEILQMYPVTFSFFLPRIYISAVKEDLKSFHFPK